MLLSDYLFRFRPRELGKRAYFDGVSLDSSPFQYRSSAWHEWIEGYIWASVHFPTSELKPVLPC